MSDTRLDVSIPANTWINLYTATGITVGTALEIYNKGSTPCNLVIRATTPVNNTMGIPIGIDSAGQHRYVSSGESGVWVYATGGSSYLSVQESA